MGFARERKMLCIRNSNSLIWLLFIRDACCICCDLCVHTYIYVQLLGNKQIVWNFMCIASEMNRRVCSQRKSSICARMMSTLANFKGRRTHTWAWYTVYVVYKPIRCVRRRNEYIQSTWLRELPIENNVFGQKVWAFECILSWCNNRIAFDVLFSSSPLAKSSFSHTLFLSTLPLAFCAKQYNLF